MQLALRAEDSPLKLLMSDGILIVMRPKGYGIASLYWNICVRGGAINCRNKGRRSKYFIIGAHYLNNVYALIRFLLIIKRY